MQAFQYPYADHPTMNSQSLLMAPSSISAGMQMGGLIIKSDTMGQYGGAISDWIPSFVTNAASAVGDYLLGPEKSIDDDNPNYESELLDRRYLLGERIKNLPRVPKEVYTGTMDFTKPMTRPIAPADPLLSHPLPPPAPPTQPEPGQVDYKPLATPMNQVIASQVGNKGDVKSLDVHGIQKAIQTKVQSTQIPADPAAAPVKPTLLDRYNAIKSLRPVTFIDNSLKTFGVRDRVRDKLSRNAVGRFVVSAADRAMQAGWGAERGVAGPEGADPFTDRNFEINQMGGRYHHRRRLY